MKSAVLCLLVGWCFAGTAAEGLSRPPITGVAHVALFSADLGKSRGFYHSFLGYQEPFSLTNQDGSTRLTFIKINERQFIELFPETKPGTDRLNHFSVETADAEGMRAWLGSRGVKVPAKVNKGQIGNVSFNVVDPDGHAVEFVQYQPDSWSSADAGKHLSDVRISAHMRHVGIIVTNLEASVGFYGGLLGFNETWRGGRTTNELSWVNLKVPEGDDYVELMLYAELPPPEKRGSAHHLCLEVPSIAKAVSDLEARSDLKKYAPKLEPRTGINRKRQLNLFDPDGTRVELMEPRTTDYIDPIR